MTDDVDAIQRQAIEACIQDAASFMLLFAKIRQHSQAPLLFHGIVAPASMYVVESYQCLTTIFPELQEVLSLEQMDLLRSSRHRAKLLDNTQRTLEDVTVELVTIAEKQRQYFLNPHRGFLAPLKKAIQPDMGLSIYDSHIFSTTHSTIFAFGENCDFEASAFTFGEVFGFYTASLLNLFQLEIPSLLEPTVLPGIIEMRDIKYETLYNRGPFDASQMKFAAGLILLLANLNYTHYILPELLLSGGHTQFRLKFLAAYHAASNIRVIQDRLAASKSLSVDAHSLFESALGNKDSRWLRKRGSLRNLLTHYLLDSRTANGFLSNTTRVDAIEHLSGGLTFGEIDMLLDRHIEHLSNILEKAFRLFGDPFWFGRVS